MQLIPFLVLGYLSLESQCIAINPRSDASRASATYSLSKRETNTAHNVSLARHDRHAHKPGEPWFGYQLPKDTTGWIDTGNLDMPDHYRHAIHYHSINPATGKPRGGNGKIYCDQDYVSRNFIMPEENECCKEWVLMFLCRTYEFKPAAPPSRISP